MIASPKLSSPRPTIDAILALQERGALPPGLQKRLVPVPALLLTRFPPVPPYYQRYFAGEDLLVIDTRSNVIVVIIRDVWR